MNEQQIISFIYTDEYQRFAEFCDACKKYRYIGLCYGRPGVGKTLSARRYTAWDKLDAFVPDSSVPTFNVPPSLQEAKNNSSVLFTPAVSNTPKQIEAGISDASNRLYSLMKMQLQSRIDAEIEEQKHTIQHHERAKPHDKAGLKRLEKALYELVDEHRYVRKVLQQSFAPSLMIVDEADR